MSSLSLTITAMIVMTAEGTFHEIIKGTPRLYFFRTLDGIFHNTVRLIYFFLISSLGPVVTTLLGMLGNISTLIFSGLFLGEKNSTKEWGVNILLCALVGLGFYLK